MRRSARLERTLRLFLIRELLAYQADATSPHSTGPPWQWLCVRRPSGFPGGQHPGDRRHRIPVARGDRGSYEPVERPEVADDFHVAPVDPDDEGMIAGDDLQ